MTLDDFTASLIDHGIVATKDLEAGLAQGPVAPTDLAGWLVQNGLLTSFQAEAALHGQAAQLNLGNYVLLNRLGRGGMGEVYQARHRRMDRIVALKTLAPELVSHPEALERFHREVKAAARLSHPNIIAAHDADEAGGIHFLVMEFAAGCDLDTVLDRCGALPMPELLQVVLQAARGLEYAHSKGVIHRDIKPPNLMLTNEGVVKILDMGLARLAETGTESFTQTNYIFGSVDYMPPEQAESARRADHRSDIYALGCTMYTLATGQAIYDGESNIQKFLNHRESPIPELTISGTSAPLALMALFRSMVAKQPTERCQSMSEVVAAIEALAPPADLTALVARARELAPPPEADPWAQTARPASTPVGSGLAGSGNTRMSPPGSGARLPLPSARATPLPGGSGTRPGSGPSRPGVPQPAAPRVGGQPQPTDPRWATRAPSAAAQASLAGAVPQAASAAASTVSAVAAPAEEEWLADAVAAQPARSPKAAGAIDQQTLVIAGAGIVGFVLVGILLLLVGAQNRGLAERPEDHAPEATSNTGQPPSIPPSYAPPPPGQAPPAKVAVSTDPQPPKNVTPEVKRPPIEPKQDPPSGEGPQAAPPKSDPPPKTVPPPKAVPKFTPGEPINVLDLLTDKNAVGKKGWQSAGRGKPWVTRNGSAVPGPRRPDTEGAGLILPVTLTTNYDLSLEVEHLQDGVGPLVLVVPAGDQWTMVVMDGAPPGGPPGLPGGPRPGPFPPPRGRPPFPKAGQRPPQGGPSGGPGPDSPGAPMLTNAVLEGRTKVIIKVRGSTVTCDDKEVDPVDASNLLGPIINLAEPDKPLLASLGGYRVHAITFTPR